METNDEMYVEDYMIIRMLAVLFTVFLFGCSGNFNLESLKAGRGGALVDFNILDFDDAPAVKALSTLDNMTDVSVTGTYDFSVEEVHFRESSFLVNGTQAPSVKLIAKNRGNAPVSVSITYDRDLSENMTWDAKKSHASVVPPYSDMEVARFDPITNRKEWKLAWYNTWNIGDYTARHVCEEQYRLPFSDKVPAYAATTKELASTPYTRNAVIFVMPPDAEVLAARKGIVVRVDKNNGVDILHDDATIATYSHLGDVAPGIRAGKAVKVGEPVGAVGKSADQAYMQLAVWRPEQKETGTLETSGMPAFQQVSFPLEFCTGSKNCKTNKHGQPVSVTAAAPAASIKSAPNAETGEYDFSIRDDHSAQQLFMPDNQNSTRIIAVNRGYAPVSVMLDLNPDSTENIKPDVSLPHTAVILPQSEMVLARLSPLDVQKGMRYSCKYVWQLGDFTTHHHCPEKYRFPFADNLQAFASVPDQNKSNHPMRYSVQFDVPVGSKVLAARKGIVVRVKNNKDIEVLHDDSTIATYGHLGMVEKDVSAGKHVSAGNMLGVAGKSEIPGKATFQLTVWRPESTSTASSKTREPSSLHAASFPLEFCSGSNGCRVLTYSQPVSARSPKKKKK